MKKALPSVLLLLSCVSCAYSQNDGDDIVVGKYRKLNSSVTNEDRTLLVWLPQSYDQSAISYPVIYLLYGQNTSAYLLPTITACDMLAASGVIPEMIIIGVATAERYRDYSSISDGYIENTIKFFTEELFPFVDRNYRTKNYRIVIGPQAGAVFSLYTLIKHPQLFNAYISENPFVGQNRELLYNMSKECFADGPLPGKFLYVTEEDNSIPANIETLKKFEEMVRAAKPSGFELILCISEPSGYFVPPVPVKDALLKLFKEFALPDTLKIKNIDDIKNFYLSVSKKYGIEIQPPDIILTFKCDELTSTGRTAEASEMLEYYLILYPQSLNALMRMADLKRSTGDYEGAIKYYDEFLKIRPVDAVAVRSRRDNIKKYINESLIYVLEKEIETKGIDQAVRNFRRTKASAENKLTYPENDFNNLGYKLLNKRKNIEGIKVFKLALEVYPKSSNLYDSMGEAYMRNNQNDFAVKNYEKSLSLNPLNENAKKILEKLKTK